MTKLHLDPVTGDPLEMGEWVSWKIQGVIRRWLFLGVVTALTAWVWIAADPIWRHPVTDQWNLWASYAAILIESITAMALINSGRRDAVVVREIRALAREEIAEIKRLVAELHADHFAAKTPTGQTTPC